MRMRNLMVRSLMAGSVIAASLTAGATLAQVSPEPLPIDFAKQGCGRLQTQAYYRSEFHFVNICRGKTGFVMVVTDNDGLGRERLPAQKQGNGFRGTSDRGVNYRINRNTLTIVLPGQPPIQEPVTEAIVNAAAPTPGTAKPPTQQATVSGVVTYLQRIALPPTAVVEVKLQDVSRTDAAAVTIAEQTIRLNGKQIPIPFRLDYNPSQIIPSHRYVVQAKVFVDGQLHWINTTAQPVLTLGNPTTIEVLVSPAARPSSSRSPIQALLAR